MPQLIIHVDGHRESHSVEQGANLRNTLIQLGHSPYAKVTRNLNCGGRGLCATCGVEVLGTPPAAVHWHDKAAQRFRYPRLSCQIQVEEDLEIRLLTGKKVWGKRIPRKEVP